MARCNDKCCVNHPCREMRRQEQHVRSLSRDAMRRATTRLWTTPCRKMRWQELRQHPLSRDVLTRAASRRRGKSLSRDAMARATSKPVARNNTWHLAGRCVWVGGRVGPTPCALGAANKDPLSAQSTRCLPPSPPPPIPPAPSPQCKLSCSKQSGRAPILRDWASRRRAQTSTSSRALSRSVPVLLHVYV